MPKSNVTNINALGRGRNPVADAKPAAPVRALTDEERKEDRVIASRDAADELLDYQAACDTGAVEYTGPRFTPRIAR